jgi:hypothetical protein
MATVSDPRNPIKARPATRPATGLCRWISKPNPDHSGGVLQINGTAYELLPLFADDDGKVLVGYRLHKAGGGLYDVDMSGPRGWTCDCPDATFHPERPGGCKHVAAVRAALAQLAR